MDYEGSGMKRVRFASSQFAELAKLLSLQSCASSIRASFARFRQIPTHSCGAAFHLAVPNYSLLLFLICQCYDRFFLVLVPDLAPEPLILCSLTVVIPPWNPSLHFH